MIRWLPKAQESLETELRRIAKENEAAAQCIAVVIKSHTKTREQFLEFGRPGRIPGTQEMVVAGLPYLLPFRMRDDVVEVLRFFHVSWIKKYLYAVYNVGESSPGVPPLLSHDCKETEIEPI